MIAAGCDRPRLVAKKLVIDASFFVGRASSVGDEMPSYKRAHRKATQRWYCGALPRREAALSGREIPPHSHVLCVDVPLLRYVRGAPRFSPGVSIAPN